MVGLVAVMAFGLFLRRHEIRAVLDATHPFARQITQRSY
jgi:precorrin-6x reductase